MICIPIMARNNVEALKKIEKAAPLADMIEIRLDVMETFDLKEIIEAASRPVLVTYRSKREGGEGSVDYETRIRYLMNAVEAGADFVDVEYRMPLEFRHQLFHSHGSSELIISTHLLHKTPSREKLQEIFREMAATGADIVKIVTHAKEPEDNLHVLDLIPLAQHLGIKIVAFCMGPVGRISRIACRALGGYMTFASLEEGEESAAGQLPAKKMKEMLDLLTP